MLNLESKREVKEVKKNQSWPVALVSCLLYFPQVVHVIHPDQDHCCLCLWCPIYNVQKFGGDSKTWPCTTHCKEEVIVVRVPVERKLNILPFVPSSFDSPDVLLCLMGVFWMDNSFSRREIQDCPIRRHNPHFQHLQSESWDMVDCLLLFKITKMLQNFFGTCSAA